MIKNLLKINSELLLYNTSLILRSDFFQNKFHSFIQFYQTFFFVTIITSCNDIFKMRRATKKPTKTTKNETTPIVETKWAKWFFYKSVFVLKKKIEFTNIKNLPDERFNVRRRLKPLYITVFIQTKSRLGYFVTLLWHLVWFFSRSC